MKKIGIVCAMQKEYDLLVREFPEGDIHCILSGIGKVNAAAAAERLVCEYRPDCILSIGCAGTFVESLNECETVIVDRCAYHDVFCGKGYEPGQMAGLPLYFQSDTSTWPASSVRQLQQVCSSASSDRARISILKNLKVTAALRFFHFTRDGKKLSIDKF